MVGHYPTIKLMSRRLIFRRVPEHPFLLPTYAVLARISPGYPPPKGRLPTCYSPVRHSTRTRRYFLVRLACVKHAASVHSEPGSNSPINIENFKTVICSFYLFSRWLVVKTFSNSKSTRLLTIDRSISNNRTLGYSHSTSSPTSTNTTSTFRFSLLRRI